MINFAVFTGEKSVEVVGFHELFRSFKGMNSYIQHIDALLQAAKDWNQFNYKT